MGEIADMMLDGTMCECCGEFMGSEGEGFPRYCSEQCAADRGVSYGRLDTDDDDEDDCHDEEPTIDGVICYLDIAICSIDNAIDVLKKLKIKSKVKELSWLIKRIKLYKLKLEE